LLATIAYAAAMIVNVSILIDPVLTNLQTPTNKVAAVIGAGVSALTVCAVTVVLGRMFKEEERNSIRRS
jgi:hypothetical protein